jgi:hypothetical protein
MSRTKTLLVAASMVGLLTLAAAAGAVAVHLAISHDAMFPMR